MNCNTCQITATRRCAIWPTSLSTCCMATLRGDVLRPARARPIERGALLARHSSIQCRLLPNTNGSGACAVPPAPRLPLPGPPGYRQKILRNVIPSGMQGFGRRTFANLGLIADAFGGLPSLSLIVKSTTARLASAQRILRNQIRLLALPCAFAVCPRQECSGMPPFPQSVPAHLLAGGDNGKNLCKYRRWPTRKQGDNSGACPRRREQQPAQVSAGLRIYPGPVRSREAHLS